MINCLDYVLQNNEIFLLNYYSFEYLRIRYKFTSHHWYDGVIKVFKSDNEINKKSYKGNYTPSLKSYTAMSVIRNYNNVACWLFGRNKFCITGKETKATILNCNTQWNGEYIKLIMIIME